MKVGLSSARAAHSHAVDAQGRLTHADGHALAFLAAGTHAAVQPQIVADHAHAGERVGAVANQCGAFHRVERLALLHPPGFAGGEHELAAGDVHLPAAEVHRVQAAVDAGEDFRRIAVSRQHVGVGHARHGHMRVALAAAIARGRAAHQPGVEHVLHITNQNAVFDQYIALCRVALVVHVERTAPVGQGAVVEHGHALGGDALAHAARERARSLAVEVAFQAVAHRLVQQYAGPAGAEHHAHLARRRGARFEVDQRGVHRLIDIFRDEGVVEVAQAIAPAAARRAGFAPSVLLDDHVHAQAHQRAHVGGQQTVGAQHQHHVVFAAQAGHDLHHARVFGARQPVHLLQQRHLGVGVERAQRVGRAVEHARRAAAGVAGHFGAALARAGNAAHRVGGFEQGQLGNVVGIGEGGLLALYRANAKALFDVEAARLHQAFFQAPALGAGVLQIDVGVVELVLEHLAQRTLQGDFVDLIGVEQDAARLVEAQQRGFGHHVHAPDCRNSGMSLRAGRFRRVSALAGRSDRGDPVARLAAVLFEQAHAVDDHAAVHRLAHVVDGEQADLHRGERFHFNAGAAAGFGGDGAVDAAVLRLQIEVHRHTVEGDGVAQGNEVGGALARHDGGGAGDADDVALFGAAALHQGEGGGLHADAAGGHGHAMRFILGADIDHMRLTGGVEVGEAGGGCAAVAHGAFGAVEAACTSWLIASRRRRASRLAASTKSRPLLA